MTELVLVTLEKGVQVLTLNRPDKKNALTPEMYGALADGIERAERDRLRPLTGRLARMNLPPAAG